MTEYRDPGIIIEEKDAEIARLRGEVERLQAQLADALRERDEAREVLRGANDRHFNTGVENESLREVIRRGMSYTNERIDQAVEEVKREQG